MKPIGIGIDFGTTNSIACVWGSDVKRILQEQGQRINPVAFWHVDPMQGKRPHPSVVWYQPSDEVKVGFEARQKMPELSGAQGHKFVRSIKRSLTTDGFVHNGKKHESYKVAAEIFRHLREDGQKRQEMYGHKFESCVVTVPVGFSGAQRKQIRRAMEHSGLHLMTFVHEPFAAMVAHFYHPEHKLDALQGKRVLVFDWGGGTLDVCLAEGADDGSTLYELAHDGIADHAGDDFDRRIMADMRGRFLQKNPGLTDDDITNRSRAIGDFWSKTEIAKIELSGQANVQIRVPKFIDGNPPLEISERLARNEFEAMIEREVDAAIACVHRCLEQARLSPSSVDSVLLVGGTSLIPLVRRRLEEVFGAKVQLTHEPDAAIARGAAIVAAEGWTAVNAVTLGCLMARDNFFPLLKRGEPLVAEASKKFIFYCTDPRDGAANFIFCRQPVHGDSGFVPFGEILQVPIATERPSEFRDLDRILFQSTVTEDATLLIQVQHTGMGHRAGLEISDVSFGLKLK